MSSRANVLPVLVCALMLSFGAAAPASAAPCPDAQLRFTKANAERFAAAQLCLVNAARAKHTLPPLGRNAALDKAAQLMAVDMVVRKFFSHIDPEGRGPAERTTAQGYTWSAVGENILFDTAGATPFSAVDAWLRSTGHCHNLYAPFYSELGLGAVTGTKLGHGGGTFVQVFGRPWGARAPSTSTGPAASCPEPLDPGIQAADPAPAPAPEPQAATVAAPGPSAPVALVRTTRSGRTLRLRLACPAGAACAVKITGTARGHKLFSRALRATIAGGREATLRGRLTAGALRASRAMLAIRLADGTVQRVVLILRAR